MNTDEGMNRRDFLRMTGAATAVAGASGTAAAQEGGGGNNSSGGGGGGASGPIDYGGWLDDAGNFNGQTKEMTGSKEVKIKVGAEGNGGSNAFSPPAVHISPGTKVIWEWTGNGAHNVVGENKDFSSGSPTTSGTFEKTFEESGIVKYFCDPHKSMGMLGAVAVGEVPRKQPTGPVTPAVSSGSKMLGVATFTAMLSTLGLAYFFLRYGGDYEQ